ncbi:MAG: zinc ribbon domain-containing protein [Actinobacteria bacterium]|nr:zinc ribbon domain-containing protein [Actinomycetota bacterium]
MRVSSDADESGTPLRCPACDTPATAGARFCRACGIALASGAPDGSGGAARRPPDNETTGELDLVNRTTADISPPSSGAAVLRTCPSCGGPNSASRELCGRCGADLETGAVPPRADGRPPGTPEASTPSRRRWLGPALLVLVVLVVTLGGLAAAGVGPFGDAAASVPPAEFDESAYTGEPERLAAAEIATRTTLAPQGGANFDPSRMVDDDASTAWNSDGSIEEVADGVGERIELLLEEPAWVAQIVIRNGDQRDADAYAANGRIQRARVTLDGGVVLLVNLLDEGLAAQAVDLTEPVLTTGVSIDVLDVFAGDTHPDLAVSDLALHGWPAAGDDVEVARERAAGRPFTATPAP